MSEQPEFVEEKVHIKIDLNHLLRPKPSSNGADNHGQLSFVILTYNMGALMAQDCRNLFCAHAQSPATLLTIYRLKG